MAELAGHREIKRSLKTPDLTVAKIRCRKLSILFDQLVALSQIMPDLTHDQARRLARAYFEREWSRASEFVFLGPSDPQFNRLAEVEFAQADEQRLRDLVTTGQVDPAVAVDVAEILKEGGFNGTVPLDELAELQTGMMRAKIEQRRLLAAMLTGQFHEAGPVDPLFRDISQPAMPLLQGQACVVDTSVAAVVEKFLAFKKPVWAPKTFLD
jgi:hypothetical protein